MSGGNERVYWRSPQYIWCKGVFTWYQRDFHSGTSSLRLWYQHKISYRTEPITGGSSPWSLDWRKIFIPIRKLIPLSCKGGIQLFVPAWKSFSGESGTKSACVVLDIQSPLYYRSFFKIRNVTDNNNNNNNTNIHELQKITLLSTAHLPC